jgi:dihydropteroate synthase
MTPRKLYKLKLRRGELALGRRTLLMGVLNVTPDSFSDGGKFFTLKRAVERALAMEREGADILDIGAESTRPGSKGISAAEELARLLPVLEALRCKLKIPISVDTQKAAVAEMAIEAGAAIVNDVSGLRHDPRLAGVVAKRGVPIVLMHMRGTPLTMQELPFARSVMKDVANGLKKSLAIARQAGIAKEKIILDPGIGFGKSFEQNYQLLGRLPELARLGSPLLVGVSRK